MPAQTGRHGSVHISPSRASWVGRCDVRLAENANSCVSFQERERLLRSKRHRGKGLKLPKVSLRGLGWPALEPCQHPRGGWWGVGTVSRPQGRHTPISAYLMVENLFLPSLRAM